MDTIVWFDVCAAFMVAILLILYYIKFNAPFQKYRLFLALLWLNFISSVTSLGTVVLPGEAPLWVTRLSNSLYFLVHSLTPAALLLYVWSLTDYNLRRMRRAFWLLLPTVFCAVVCVLSYFTDVLYWLEADGTYHRGSGLAILYVVTAFNFGAIIFSLIRHRKQLQFRERFSIYLFLGVMVGAIGVQVLIPELLIENFSCVCCLMISQLMVQNPELILDGSTRMLNKAGLSYLLTPLIVDRQELEIGFFLVDNYYALEKALGVNTLEQRIFGLAEAMQENSPCYFARVENRRFCFVSKQLHRDGSVERSLRHLNALLSDQATTYTGKVYPQFKYGTFSCPEDAESFTDLMALLDAVSARPAMSDALMTRLTGEELHRAKRWKQLDRIVQSAAEDGTLYVQYQPIYSLRERRFVSAEALLHMHTPELGEVSPSEFIPVAEANGAILKLTRHLIDEVCRFLHDADLQKYGLHSIDINLSAPDCVQPNIYQTVLAAAQRHSIAPTYINVEITETAFSTMGDRIAANLALFSGAGLKVLIDDYGTGYSNLSRLIQVPLDIVKLDKSLIDEVPASPTARIVLDNTLQMMQMLKKDVLVEGVETKAQLDYLESSGLCDYIQGYYFARPMTPKELCELFRQQWEHANSTPANT